MFSDKFFYLLLLATLSFRFMCLGSTEIGRNFNSDMYDSNLVVKTIDFERNSTITEFSEVGGDMVIRTNDIQLRLNPKILECRSELNLSGDILTNTITSSDLNQWFLWSLDTFDPKEQRNWMPGDTSTCNESNDFFLGGPCKLGPGRVNRFYNGLPPHKEIRVTGRVHFFDMWNGESITFRADNNVLWSEFYDWCPSITDATCRKYGIDVCGQEYPDRLSTYFSVSMPHSHDKLSLEFQSSLESYPCEASWGIDDIALYLRQ